MKIILEHELEKLLKSQINEQSPDPDYSKMQPARAPIGDPASELPGAGTKHISTQATDFGKKAKDIKKARPGSPNPFMKRKKGHHVRGKKLGLYYDKSVRDRKSFIKWQEHLIREADKQYARPLKKCEMEDPRCFQLYVKPKRKKPVSVEGQSEDHAAGWRPVYFYLPEGDAQTFFWSSLHILSRFMKETKLLAGPDAFKTKTGDPAGRRTMTGKFGVLQKSIIGLKELPHDVRSVFNQIYFNYGADYKAIDKTIRKIREEIARISEENKGRLERAVSRIPHERSGPVSYAGRRAGMGSKFYEGKPEEAMYKIKSLIQWGPDQKDLDDMGFHELEGQGYSRTEALVRANRVYVERILKKYGIPMKAFALMRASQVRVDKIKQLIDVLEDYRKRVQHLGRFAAGQQIAREQERMIIQRQMNDMVKIDKLLAHSILHNEAQEMLMDDEHLLLVNRAALAAKTLRQKQARLKEINEYEAGLGRQGKLELKAKGINPRVDQTKRNHFQFMRTGKFPSCKEFEVLGDASEQEQIRHKACLRMQKHYKNIKSMPQQVREWEEENEADREYGASVMICGMQGLKFDGYSQRRGVCSANWSLKAKKQANCRGQKTFNPFADDSAMPDPCIDKKLLMAILRKLNPHPDWRSSPTSGRAMLTNGPHWILNMDRDEAIRQGFIKGGRWHPAVLNEMWSTAQNEHPSELPGRLEDYGAGEIGDIRNQGRVRPSEPGQLQRAAKECEKICNAKFPDQKRACIQDCVKEGGMNDECIRVNMTLWDQPEKFKQAVARCKETRKRGAGQMGGPAPVAAEPGDE